VNKHSYSPNHTADSTEKDFHLSLNCKHAPGKRFPLFTGAWYLCSLQPDSQDFNHHSLEVTPPENISNMKTARFNNQAQEPEVLMSIQKLWQETVHPSYMAPSSNYF